MKKGDPSRINLSKIRTSLEFKLNSCWLLLSEWSTPKSILCEVSECCHPYAQVLGNLDCCSNCLNKNFYFYSKQHDKSSIAFSSLLPADNLTSVQYLHMVVVTYVHIISNNSCMAIAAWPATEAAFFFQMVRKLRSLDLHFTSCVRTLDGRH